jgi:hypothetical protein
MRANKAETLPELLVKTMIGQRRTNVKPSVYFLRCFGFDGFYLTCVKMAYFVTAGQLAEAYPTK